MDTHINEFKRFLRFCSPRILHKYGGEIHGAIISRAPVDYRKLIPEIPFLGGRDNPGTSTLVQTSWLLNLYRALNEITGDPGANRRFLYDTGSSWFLRHPLFYYRIVGRLKYSCRAFRNWQLLSERSRKREFEGDWVFSAMRGDGIDFDWGVDYTECAILKFYTAQGAPELTPVMCLLDFPISQAYGSGLRRTEALAMGGSRCDFRFKQGRPAGQADIDKL